MATAPVEQLFQPLPSQPPDPAQLLMQMCTGYMVSSALYPVAKLGIAELVAESPQPVSELAEQTGANDDALYRILRALSSVGIFAEVSPRTFGLTPVANM